MNTIKAFKLDPEAVLPTRTHPTDAGLDLYSLENTFIPLSATVRIKTGIALEIPLGFVGKIEGRSSMNAKGIMASGGVIDTGYAGDISVILNNFSNTSQFSENSRGLIINKGDKIAQLLVYQVATPAIEEVSEIWTSERGTKGFGQASGR